MSMLLHDIEILWGSETDSPFEGTFALTHTINLYNMICKVVSLGTTCRQGFYLAIFLWYDNDRDLFSGSQRIASRYLINMD